MKTLSKIQKIYKAVGVLARIAEEHGYFLIL